MPYRMIAPKIDPAVAARIAPGLVMLVDRITNPVKVRMISDGLG